MKPPILHDPEFDQDALPPRWEEAILRELEGSEKLIWAGRPIPWRPARAEWAAFGMGLGITAFALYWAIGAIHAYRAGTSFRWPSLLGTMMLGPILLATPFRAWYQVSRTTYALTDRRAIIREPRVGPGPDATLVRSFLPREIGTMICSERADGSGDLIISKSAPAGWGPEIGVAGRGFLAVDRVREVERLARSTAEAGWHPPPPEPIKPTMPALHDPEFDLGPAPPAPGSEILPLLEAGEELVWAGRPGPWRLVEPKLFSLCVGVLFLGGSPIFVVASCLTPETHPVNTVVGGLMAIAFGSLLLARSLNARDRGLKTCYALTNRRVIIREPRSWLEGKGFRVRSYQDEPLRLLYRSERPDGSGDLIFAGRLRVPEWDRWPSPPSRPTFLGVEDVKAVERLVRSTLKDE